MDIAEYLENKQPRGHNHIGTCKFCGETVQWRRNKIINHVLNSCPSAPQLNQQACKRLKTGATSMLSINASNNNSDITSTFSSQSNSTSRVSSMERWIDTCNSTMKDDLDSAIAKFFYRTAIPFNVADCQEWKDIWSLARPAYQPPKSKVLRTTLLKKEYFKMKMNVQEIVKEAHSVSIVSDGWSNIRNEHLVNFILIIPNQKPLFYGYIDCDGESQTSVQIASDLIKVIEEIRVEKVSSVVTDNAVTMQGAWDIIEKKYPHIFCNGCAAHVLNLVIQDICTMDGSEDIINKAILVSKFIKYRNALCVAFRKAQKNQAFKKFLTLPIKTRWYTQYECLNNLVNNEDIIQQLCVTKNYRQQYRKSDKWEEFINTVNDDSFWDGCRKLITKLKLPTKMIGDAESDNTSLSQVYVYFQQLLESNVYSEEETSKINQRWNFIHTESMGFAYILNPKTKGGLGMVGNDLEDSYVQLQEFLKNQNETEAVISEEFNKFTEYVAEPSSKLEVFFNSKSFNPRTWWLVHGRNKFPVLSKLACRIFAIPTSSASSERVWSVFSLIHTKKRCRLKNETVNKLVYVYINSQLKVNQNDQDPAIDYFLEQINGGEDIVTDDDNESDVED